MLVWIISISTPSYKVDIPEPEAGDGDHYDVEVLISANLFEEESIPEKGEGSVLFQIQLEIKEGDHSYLEMEAEFYYGIGEIEDTGKKSFHLPKSIKRHLLGASISTLRGMLMQHTRGTMLDGFVLPLIDEGELLNEMHQATKGSPSPN